MKPTDISAPQLNNELIKYISDLDSGNEMKSVEMGGITPGYELAIQKTFVELIRAYSKIHLPFHEGMLQWLSREKSVVFSRLSNILGLSGAQAAAASNLAFAFWNTSPQECLNLYNDHDESRIIIIKMDSTGNLTLPYYTRNELTKK